MGYVNTTDALTKHVDKEDKSTVVISDGKGNPNKVVINESGFYSLITIKKSTTGGDVLLRGIFIACLYWMILYINN